ncbi:MAG: replication-associated recombination protein A [Ignavibacteria bacterium]|jgi:putative ATPase|nr:replication-associated recombination protein A [Ignavibacteria bacterium]
MNELFNVENDDRNKPLAERVRPKTIDDIVGQTHLLGKEAPLRVFFENKQFPSMIFWGPPGVGKTTFALLIAEIADYAFFHLSAVEAGVKDIREIITRASNLQRSGKRTLLFIDEIHRFNKSQQDALLHAVEQGIITLVGATTENPSFEVNSALMSRCQVYRLQFLTDAEIKKIVENALKNDVILKQIKIEIKDWEFLLAIAAGDARAALNAIDLAVKFFSYDKEITLTQEVFEKALQKKSLHYDKSGEEHYNTISAFIKSLRGSDPDAALLWLAKMLEAGEDPVFIARRLVIFASEDVGNAEPFAITLATSVFQAVQMIGMPECKLNLAQCVTYLASCAKSNASYLAINEAIADVKKTSNLSVPLHLRNAPTEYMKKESYALNYKYPHNFENHFVEENYFPINFEPKKYYKPTNFGKEKVFNERLNIFWKNRKK